MTNQEKAKEIYLYVLVEHNGWDKKAAEKAFNEDGEYDPLYRKIINVLKR